MRPCTGTKQLQAVVRSGPVWRRGGKRGRARAQRGCTVRLLLRFVHRDESTALGGPCKSNPYTYSTNDSQTLRPPEKWTVGSGCRHFWNILKAPQQAHWAPAGNGGLFHLHNFRVSSEQRDQDLVVTTTLWDDGPVLLHAHHLRCPLWPSHCAHGRGLGHPESAAVESGCLGFRTLSSGQSQRVPMSREPQRAGRTNTALAKE